MGLQGAAEQPRHIIVSVRVSPMVELTRWLFERYRLPYHEQSHAPLLHVLATRRNGGGTEVPVVVGAEGIWAGASEILDGLDAKSRPGDRLYGEEDRERGDNRRLIAELLQLLLPAVRRAVYYHLLPHRKLLLPVAVDGAPLWERAFVSLLYPLWRRLMARGLDLSTERMAEAQVATGKACDMIEAALVRRGTRFVGGSRPNSVDIVFSALLAPLVLPAEYGIKLPALDDLPPALQRIVAETRARPAGRLALQTYETARPPAQPYMPRRKGGGLLSALLLGPTLPRLGARFAAAYGHVIRISRYALASRWDDVEEILRRDLDFRIVPINAPRIEEVNGPFVLGLDRGDRMAVERGQLYTAVAAIDLAGVRSLARAQAEWLLDHAAAGQGHIDVVNGYARLVAARNARRLFGIPGPTEMDLMRVIRAIFNHTFLNLFGDQEARARALVAAAELKEWFEAEIARRHTQKLDIDDVIGRLLALRGKHPQALDDDGVRRNVAGLLVGSIDTTATVVGKIVAMCVADSALMARVRRDLDNPQRLFGWCNEVLRLWPHNPILLRKTETDVPLGGVVIPANTTVAAFTHAALFDAGRFPDPGHLDPDRSPKLYRHFGGGLHPCAGRAVNEVQIPELVRCILKRDIVRVSRPRYDGFFIDELVVAMNRSAS